MVVIATFVEALIYVVNALVSVYSFVVIAACLISWVNPDPYNPIVRILKNLTEPALWRIRKYMPFTYTSGLDFSPVVLLILLHVARIVFNRLAGALLS